MSHVLDTILLVVMTVTIVSLVLSSYMKKHDLFEWIINTAFMVVIGLIFGFTVAEILFGGCG
ncbi:MAG: hypothetical protein D6698_15455 [Gammaproteobacteria bacterium]|nr:MAG: hypothetical protein D6698_15455 [Gammaproteobacteria bacterium]